ncbi:MAG: ABC transporter ATP-binding protein [Coriobacteriia bacterium]|nr:ABC transporter ATP-binding protein [Coriobacteriia bacterium]
MPEPALRIEAVTSGYGRVQVLRDVSLKVAPGELVALIGGNGAGKSTLLQTVAGLLPAWSGRVTLFDEDVTRVPADRLVGRGLALVPEGRLLFGPMSVEENLRLGAYSRGREGRRTFAEDVERVTTLFPVLGHRLEQHAATLSGGEQQMLAVGRALMSRPRVLLLDEPSLGLAPKVIAEIFAALTALRADGLTVLLVEQDAKLALEHADRGHVMRTGQIVLSGPAEELLADDDVRLIYLGAWQRPVPG